MPRLFIDTAPIIYFVEKNARYAALVQIVFELIDNRALSAVTSPITLAECLVHPYRRDLGQLQIDFVDVIVNGDNTAFVPIDDAIARRGAQLRARHNLALDDAFKLPPRSAPNVRPFSQTTSPSSA